jgi:magnesium-transporting ATPase (P-type)
MTPARPPLSPTGSASWDGGGVLTGGVLARLDQEGLAERVAGTRVFTCTSPEQKLRLVGAWGTGARWWP